MHPSDITLSVQDQLEKKAIPIQLPFSHRQNGKSSHCYWKVFGYLSVCVSWKNCLLEKGKMKGKLWLVIKKANWIFIFQFINTTVRVFLSFLSDFFPRLGKSWLQEDNRKTIQSTKNGANTIRKNLRAAFPFVFSQFANVNLWHFESSFHSLHGARRGAEQRMSRVAVYHFVQCTCLINNNQPPTYEEHRKWMWAGRKLVGLLVYRMEWGFQFVACFVSKLLWFTKP